MPTFSTHSFAFQDGKGTLDAVKAAAQFVSEGQTWVVEADIRSYFDNIPHDLLLLRLQNRFQDNTFLDLLMKYLKVPVLKDGEININQRGVIQGSAISPLLGNLYLDELDRFCEDSGLSFIRFGDDLKVFTTSYETGSQILNTLISFLENTLQLPLAKEKCGVFPAVNHRLLGYQLVQTANGLEIQKFTKRKQSEYSTWHSSSLQKRDDAYHLIGNGILTKKDFALLFENETVKANLPVECIHNINVYSDIVFSSGFFQYANRNQLTVNFFDQYGIFQGSYVPERAVGHLKIALAQIRAYSNEQQRLYLAKQIIAAGVHNFRANVRHYGKHNINSVFQDAKNQLSEYEKQIQAATLVADILLLEAKARKLYFSIYNDMLPDDDFTFINRSRRPPKDPINALISFGNMYLYNEIARQIYQSPLDIRISFLHSIGRRNRSLNLDLAEIFKPLIVDRVIFSIINLRMISETNYFTRDEESGAVLLNHDRKRLFLTKLREKCSSL